jgi:hypothetical protein
MPIYHQRLPFPGQSRAEFGSDLIPPELLSGYWTRPPKGVAVVGFAELRFDGPALPTSEVTLEATVYP